jgi:uncharacterized RDD family membrane protein YckC
VLRALLRRRRYRPASRRRRVLAEMIDVAIFGPPFWAYFYLYEVRRRREDAGKLASAGPLRHALELLSFALAVQGDRCHTPGFRRLGLTVVDTRRGAEVDLPTALTRALIVRVPGYLAKRVVAHSKLRKRADESARRLQELEPQLKELRATHQDDEEALHAATMALYKQEALNPFSGCGPALAQLALAIPTGRAGRRLRDRVTGKTLVVESKR